MAHWNQRPKPFQLGHIHILACAVQPHAQMVSHWCARGRGWAGIGTVHIMSPRGNFDESRPIRLWKPASAKARLLRMRKYRLIRYQTTDRTSTESRRAHCSSTVHMNATRS